MKLILKICLLTAFMILYGCSSGFEGKVEDTKVKNFISNSKYGEKTFKYILNDYKLKKKVSSSSDENEFRERIFFIISVNCKSEEYKKFANQNSIEDMLIAFIFIKSKVAVIHKNKVFTPDAQVMYKFKNGKSFEMPLTRNDVNEILGVIAANEPIDFEKILKRVR